MNIVERILQVFNRNYPTEVRDDVWNYCMSKATATELNEANLENMCSTSLTTGFCGAEVKRGITRLAEACGVAGLSNPETDEFYGYPTYARTNVNGLTPDEVLDRIQASLNFPVIFPPFSGNCLAGLQTTRGIITNRHLYYVWVLKRITELCPDRRSSIIEIGAGFGLLGYYLEKAGYHDYTTIDLALVNACQTYFLHKNLPHRNLILSGDVENPFDERYKHDIKLLHSTDFKNVPAQSFDIMVNMDGLTEYGVAEAQKYVESDCAPVLLSINHEVNPYRVCELQQPQRIRKYRYPFWLRDGYVEELFVPKTPQITQHV